LPMVGRLFQGRWCAATSSLKVKEGCQVFGEPLMSDAKKWNLMHQKFRMQRAGGIDAFENVDHVVGGDAKRV
jgi:hypothetical protein